VPDDRLAAATAELYGAAPEAFTERRGELAAAARDAGDRAAAKAITALRRPTRAAWVVNRLAQTDPGAPARLAELAAALRAAQEARHGPRLRELSAARGALVDALTAKALAAADVADPPPSLRLEVSQTLTAALADPEVAAAFAAGTLTRAVQWSGFGVLPADAEPDEETNGTARTSGQPEAFTKNEDPLAGETAKTAGAVRRVRAGTDHAEAAAAEQRADAGERLARAAAERAAQHREQYAEAERGVAAAATAAAEAVAAEDRLEAEVRDLEQRVTRARADLATARMRARHAESAERRARQALDRLPRD
jgi:hypothetical protein